MPPRTVETQVRVRYAETDGQRVAHHSVYLVWFELGRAALLRECGLDYNAMEDQGLFFVVTEAHVKYLTPAHYDDLLTVRTTVEAVRSRELSVSYEVSRDDATLARGDTRLALVDRAGRAVAFPDNVREALGGPEPPALGDVVISPQA